MYKITFQRDLDYIGGNCFIETTNKVREVIKKSIQIEVGDVVVLSQFIGPPGWSQEMEQFLGREIVVKEINDRDWIVVRGTDTLKAKWFFPKTSATLIRKFQKDKKKLNINIMKYVNKDKDKNKNNNNNDSKETT